MKSEHKFKTGKNNFKIIISNTPGFLLLLQHLSQASFKLGNTPGIDFLFFSFFFLRKQIISKKYFCTLVSQNNVSDLQTLLTYYFTPLITTKWTLPAFLPFRIKSLMKLGEMWTPVTSEMALLLYLSFPIKTHFIKTPKFPQFFDGCFVSPQHYLSASYISCLQYRLGGKQAVLAAAVNKQAGTHL